MKNKAGINIVDMALSDYFEKPLGSNIETPMEKNVKAHDIDKNLKVKERAHEKLIIADVSHLHRTSRQCRHGIVSDVAKQAIVEEKSLIQQVNLLST